MNKKVLTITKKDLNYGVDIPKGTTSEDLFLGLTSFLIQFEKYQKDNGHEYSGESFLSTLGIYYKSFKE